MTFGTTFVNTIIPNDCKVLHTPPAVREDQIEDTTWEVIVVYFKIFVLALLSVTRNAVQVCKIKIIKKTALMYRPCSAARYFKCLL